LGRVPHQVTVRSDPEGQSLTADVRYFGDLAVCFEIQARLPSRFEVGYGVDSQGTTAS
jgi:hypothetical protein